MISVFASCAAPEPETVAGEIATRPAAPAELPTRAPETGAPSPAVGVDDAKLLGVAASPTGDRRVGDAAEVGGVTVTVTAVRTGGGQLTAAFTVENRGQAPVVLSPGNYRLRTDGARPRMRLTGTPEPLPIGTLQPGEALRGEVTWEVPDGATEAVMVVSASDIAAWMVSQ